ncbi:MAG: ribose 5-phosphate isomerase B [Acidobacteria bacterium]|nr:ribose 5-phosphate isomerase B [Acidobacteriota bacterium]
MRVAVACDHAGFPLKQIVLEELGRLGHETLDLGTHSSDPYDYPQAARDVAEAVLGGRAARGLLICGSGAGACVAANKFPGIRAATCHDTYSARQAVEHDGLNVLCLGARVVGPELALELVRSYAAASFSGEERHRKRLDLVAKFERSFGRMPEASARLRTR